MPQPGSISGAGLVVDGVSMTVPRRTATPAIGRQGVKLLSQVPLFAGLSHRHLRRIADVAEPVRFGEGRAIVEEGFRGGGFFVILEGSAKVIRKHLTVARLGPGDSFGELAIIDGGPRSASVVSTSRVLTARLTRAAFRKVLKREPDVSLRIMENLAARVRELQGARAD